MLRIPDRLEATDRRRVGRPTSLTQEVARTIIEAMRCGNFLESAAALAGVSVSSVRNWIRAGRRGQSPALAEFARAVAKARAEAEIADLNHIREDPSWQAAAWRLERRHPKRWGRRTYKQKPKPEPPLLSPEEVAAEIRAVLASLPDEPSPQ